MGLYNISVKNTDFCSFKEWKGVKNPFPFFFNYLINHCELTKINELFYPLQTYLNIIKYFQKERGLNYAKNYLGQVCSSTCRLFN